MKFLHTSDWHVGKTLKGRSRLGEQEAVLTEIVGLAEQHQVNAVLIAGDLYDAAAPSADAQRILIKTLLALAGTGAQVIAMAGDHDSPGMLDAYRPLAGYAGITLLGQPRAADRGGVVTFTARNTAKPSIAVLPFLSQRWAIRAADLLTQTPAEAAGSYDQQIRELSPTSKPGSPLARSISSWRTSPSPAPFTAAANAPRRLSSNTGCPRLRSGPNRTTSPLATCTDARHCPPAVLSPTPAPRSASTSANRTTPRSSSSSRPHRVSRPAPPTCR